MKDTRKANRLSLHSCRKCTSCSTSYGSRNQLRIQGSEKYGEYLKKILYYGKRCISKNDEVSVFEVGRGVLRGRNDNVSFTVINFKKVHIHHICSSRMVVDDLTGSSGLEGRIWKEKDNRSGEEASSWVCCTQREDFCIYLSEVLQSAHCSQPGTPVSLHSPLQGPTVDAHSRQ